MNLQKLIEVINTDKIIISDECFLNEITNDTILTENSKNILKEEFKKNIESKKFLLRFWNRVKINTFKDTIKNFINTDLKEARSYTIFATLANILQPFYSDLQ